MEQLVKMVYKHLIWDWNGTLLDDAQQCVEAMNTILNRRGMKPINLDIYRENFDFPIRQYYDFLGFSDSDTFESVSHEFIAEISIRNALCALHPGAIEILELCHSRSIEQVILSAHHQESLETIVTDYGIRDFFDKLIGLDNIYAAGKVTRGVDHFASLRHEPHEVLLIGDTVHDAEVAQTIGADCLLISSGHQTSERLKSCGCPVIESLNQVRNYIEAKQPV